MTSGLCCSLSSLQVNYATPKSGGRGGRGGGGGGKGRAGLVRGGWGGGGDKGRVESVREGRVEGVGWGGVSKRRVGWRGRWGGGKRREAEGGTYVVCIQTVPRPIFYVDDRRGQSTVVV